MGGLGEWWKVILVRLLLAGRVHWMGAVRFGEREDGYPTELFDGYILRLEECRVENRPDRE